MLMPRRTMPTILTSLLLVTCWLLSPANAGVLLDNTNGGQNTLNSGNITTLSANFYQGVVFEAKQNIVLDSLTVGISNTFKTTGTLALYRLASDVANPATSGSILLGSVSTGEINIATSPRYLTFSLASLPTLDTDQHYAIVLQNFTVSGTNTARWHELDPVIGPTSTSSVDFLRYTHSSGGSTWYTSGDNNSFYLQGTPSGAAVPEPTSIALAGIGFGVFAARRYFRRRRTANVTAA